MKLTYFAFCTLVLIWIGVLECCLGEVTIINGKMNLNKTLPRKQLVPNMFLPVPPWQFIELLWFSSQDVEL